MVKPAHSKYKAIHSYIKFPVIAKYLFDFFERLGPQIEVGAALLTFQMVMRKAGKIVITIIITDNFLHFHRPAAIIGTFSFHGQFRQYHKLRTSPRQEDYRLVCLLA